MIYKNIFTVLKKPHYRIALIYFIISFLWIIYSDKVTYDLFQDLRLYQEVQSIKGLAFIFFTAILIFILIRSSYNTITKQNVQLKSDQKKTKLAIDAVSLGIIQYDFKNEKITLDERGKKYLDTEKTEMEFLEVRERIHPDDREAVKEKLDKIYNMEVNAENSGVFRYIYNNGEIHWIESNIILSDTLDEFNKPEYAFGTVLDVTEKIKLDEHLYELEYAVDKVNICVLRFNEEGDIVYTNQFASKIYGYSSEELKNQSLFTLNPRFPKDTFNKELEKVRSQKLSIFQSIHKRKDGTDFPVEATIIHFKKNEKNIYYAFIKDITEQKEAVEALISSEAKFRKIAENAPDPIFIRVGYNFRYLNPAFCKLIGINSQEELIGKNSADHFHEHDRKQIYQRINQLDKENKPLSSYAELRLIKTDGSLVWVETAAQSIEFEGEPGAIVFVRNISDRKFAEEALKHTEENFRKIVEGAPDPIFIQTDQKFAYINPAFSKLLGLNNTNDLLGEPVIERFHPDYRDKILGRIKKLNEEFSPVEDLAEFQLLKMDGSTIWVETAGEPIEYKGKNGALVFVRNISARKQAEENINRQRKILEIFIEHAPASIAMFDKEMRYISVSRRFYKDYDITEENIIGKSHYEVFPDIPERWKEIHQRCLKGVIERSEEDPFPRVNGTLDWIRWEIRPWYEESNTIGGIILFSEVITKQKLAEKALFESEKRFQIAMRASQDGLFDWNLLTNEVYYSPGWKKMLGFEDYELPNTFSIWETYTHPDDAKRKLEMLHRMMNKEIEHGVIQLRMKHKNGSWVEILSRSDVLFDENDTPIRMVGIHTDITEWNRVQEQIKINEERLKLTLEGADLGAWDWYLKTNKTVFSNRWTEMLGYKLDEIEQNFETFKNLVHPDDLETMFKDVNNHVEGRTEMYESEFRMKHKNGNWVWILDRGKVIERDEEGNAVRLAGTHLDLTERKQAEDQLKQTQHQLRQLFTNLDSIREEERKSLARELHDELGQVLTSLNMNLSLLKNSVAKDAFDKHQLLTELSEMSNIVDESKINIKGLIRSLRPEYLDNLGLIPALNYLVEEFLKNSNINVAFKHNFEELSIDSHKENIIYRVIQESLTNAAKYAKAKNIEISLLLNDDKLNAKISDDGIGINPKDLSKKDSFGLLGMKERLSQIESELNISGEYGKGTNLSFVIKC